MIDLASELGALGLRPLQLPSHPLDDRRWAQLLHLADRERVVGVLAHGVATGAVTVDDSQYEQVASMQRRSAATDLELERRLVRWCEGLTGAGVAHRVLKGAALAHLAYPDPGLRSFGDVDLLVPMEQLAEAVDALAVVGLRRREPEVRRGFDARFGKGTTLVDDDGWELDLHRLLAAGPYGQLARTNELFDEEPETLHLGGVHLEALPLPSALVVACCNAALGDAVPRLSPLRDVVVLVRRTGSELEGVLGRATRWRLDAVVARAVRMAWDRLALPDRPAIVDWAKSQPCSARDRRWLDLYGEQRSYAQLTFASMRTMPHWRDRAALAAALALRGSSSPGRSPRQQVQRALSLLVGRPVPR